MNEPVAGEQRSKAVAVAEALNNLLYELVLRCIKDESEGPRHYYDIGVIGYGPSVASAFGGALMGRDMVSIVDVADNPVRVEERESVSSPGSDGDMGTVPRRHKFPVWVDSVADQRTPMCEALNRVGGMLATWVQQHPDSFPPIVINISDGAATDGDPRVWSKRIQSLSTKDGNVLLFNLNVSALSNAPLFFPSNPATLDNDYARLLFEMSSNLPPYMASLAQGMGMSLDAGAKGFVYNADMSAVVRFLQIGTATSQAIR
ncbi:MAG: hypothetical protein R2754_17750 [Microthrixaceae bacterium]